MSNANWSSTKNLNVLADGIQIDDNLCESVGQTNAIQHIMAALAPGASPEFTAVDLGDTVLSDYKEGTFTPVVADASSGGNEATTTASSGEYTRIGRVVNVHIRLVNIDTTGLTGGNDLYITGLPYAVGAHAVGTGAVPLMRLVTFTGTPVIELTNAQTYARIAEMTSNATFDYITISEVTSGTADMYVSFNYYV